MDGPETQTNLSKFLALFSKHQVPITDLRFLCNNVHYTLFEDFGPSTLKEIFVRLPLLQKLCVDHDNTEGSDEEPGCDSWLRSGLTWVSPDEVD